MKLTWDGEKRRKKKGKNRKKEKITWDRNEGTGMREMSGGEW